MNAVAINRSSLTGDTDRWQAVIDRDRNANGQFVYAVKTTGIYCRPTCAARLALRKHVEFFSRPQDAEHAGYRACKRCKPQHAVCDHPQAEAVTKACQIIAESQETIDVSALATKVGLSASYFHRLFKSLTGLTPKAYATAQRSQRLRNELSRSDSITTAIYNAGFNSSGRFYATSSQTLGMKPGTFRAGGEGTTIQFAIDKCSLGSIVVAATQTGICYVALGDRRAALIDELRKTFPKANLAAGNHGFQQMVSMVITFVEQPSIGLQLPLEVRGTAFQHRVWQKLSEIPCGKTQSYSQIARALGNPGAVRAVASACAANSLAVVIPCHRVVRRDGRLSGYRWGIERKRKLLERERGTASELLHRDR